MRRRRSTILASLIGALVWPVDAGAQTELPDLHADVGGNNVRISARVPANGPFDDVIVGGNYTADLTSFLSHPPGTCSDHNSAALQPVVGCTIPPPGLVPGGRFFIDLQTDPGCLNGRVFLVEVQNSTSGAAADGVAPCTQSQGADLGLTLTRVAQRALYERTNAGSVPFPDLEIDLPTGLDTLFVDAKVTNHGPGMAQESELAISGPPLLPNRASYHLTDPGGQPGVNCPRRTVTCELGDLGKGESRVVSLQVVFRRTGRLAIPLVALSTTHDPGPKPNRASFVEDVKQLPDSNVGRPSEDELSGTSSGGARAIRLGVVLTGGGAKVPGKGAYGGGSAASCRWVTSVAVRFKRQAGRQCNRPVWLKAKGTRRWRLAFRRPLPPGRYTVISSASARSGMAETSFSKRDGNRRTFTVRR